MDSYTATGLAEGWITTDNEDEIIKAWQYLHDTGLAYKLQGWFGRTAQGLLNEGVITDNNEKRLHE
jgi:hypothetical protein